LPMQFVTYISVIIIAIITNKCNHKYHKQCSGELKIASYVMSANKHLLEQLLCWVSPLDYH